MIASATDRAAFLDAAARAGLLSPRQIDRAATMTGDARELADQLVRAGTLTRFQADRLLAGRTDGFNLGPYIILEPIGKGRTGKVYKARHKSMHRLAAVKVLAPDRSNTPAARDAVGREARIAAKLVHPNVVTTFDANQYQGRSYLVLEYVDGADLTAVVRRDGPTSVERACEYVRQAALGLAHAHAQGIDHGHLTPGDLLLGRPGGTGPADSPVVKLLNFGFGKLSAFDRDATGELRAAVSAIDYLAPEQLLDPGHASDRADVFALGAVFYFLLTGRPPAAEGGLLHQTAGAIPVERVRADVPPAVAALIRAMLSVKPGKRPTAAAVAARLEPLAAGVSTGDVQFDYPVPDGASGRTYLSGLMPGVGDPSPFAGMMETDAEMGGAEAVTLGTDERTPLSTRRPNAGGLPRWAVVAGLGLAAAVVLIAGLAVGAVLRAGVR